MCIRKKITKIWGRKELKGTQLRSFWPQTTSNAPQIHSQNWKSAARPRLRQKRPQLSSFELLSSSNFCYFFPLCTQSWRDFLCQKFAIMHIGAAFWDLVLQAAGLFFWGRKELKWTQSRSFWPQTRSNEPQIQPKFIPKLKKCSKTSFEAEMTSIEFLWAPFCLKFL